MLTYQYGDRIPKEDSIVIVARSSLPEMLCKNGVLKNFAILKERLWHRCCFPVNFKEIFKNTYLFL